MANRADKVHEFLPLKSRKRVFLANDAANALGMPLNVTATVNIGNHKAVNSGLIGWQPARVRLFEGLRHFFAYRGYQFLYWCVTECAPDRGYHLHFAVHVPGCIKLSELQAYILGQIGDADRILHIDLASRHERGTYGWAVYATKGINPRHYQTAHPIVPRQFWADRKPQLPVPGHRVRIARALTKVIKEGIPQPADTVIRRQAQAHAAAMRRQKVA